MRKFGYGFVARAELTGGLLQGFATVHRNHPRSTHALEKETHLTGGAFLP